MESTLHFFHTNDLHAHFNYWYDQKQWLEQQRAMLKQAGDHVVVLDIGDFCDRVHPIVEATKGRVATRLLNELQVDLITIGNNEGLGHSHEQLLAMYEGRQFGVCVANLFDRRTKQRPPFVHAYVIKEIAGCRIAFIGLTAPFPDSYMPNGWQVEPYDAVLPKVMGQLAGQCDEIVLLSHLGLQTDREIAQKYPLISLIFGAHTHHVLESGEWCHSTLLTGGGKYGQYIGHVQVSIANNRFVRKKATLVDWHGQKESKAALQWAVELKLEGERLLKSNYIAENPKKMKNNWFMTNDLVQLGMDAMSAFAKEEIAILEAGVWLSDLEQGKLSQYDLHRALPHPIHLNRGRLFGEQFVQLIKTIEQQQARLAALPLKGRGFRGKVLGRIFFKGVEFEKNRAIVRIDGRIVEPDEVITFVCTDHLRFLPYFRMIEEQGQNEILYPLLLREIIAWYLNR